MKLSIVFTVIFVLLWCPYESLAMGRARPHHRPKRPGTTRIRPSHGGTSTRNVEWPVFFEKLGHVHSIHNKFDLALRVHIDVPMVEARVGRVIKKLDILNTDFKDPSFKRRYGSNHPSRLEDLNLSWKEQNKRLRKLSFIKLQLQSSDPVECIIPEIYFIRRSGRSTY